MKTILAMLIAISAMCTSCTFEYKIDQEVILTDRQYQMAKDLYGDTISFDNIYYVDMKGEYGGMYYSLEDKILIDNGESNEDWLNERILHELYHRYQHKHFGSSNIECDELENPAYIAMHYALYREECIGLKDYVRDDITYSVYQYGKDEIMFSYKYRGLDAIQDFTLDNYKEWLREHTEFKY